MIRYSVYTTSSTGMFVEVLLSGQTEEQAQAMCEAYEWTYIDEYGDTYLMDYRAE